jgi:hypothetical protein
LKIRKKPVYVSLILIIASSISILIGINFIFQNNNNIESGFPDFITNNEDYFITRISSIPEIDAINYQLTIKGEVENPTNYTLQDLYQLDMIEIPLTTECIGNQVNGPLISTAYWKGFNIYDLINSLGIKENATAIRYTAADGYFVSNTLQQIKDNGTLGALYMNGDILPAVQGYPLRIVNPGAYGAKQPAWVIEMEIINTTIVDFWDSYGWDTSPPMPPDSIIFFPKDEVQVKVNETLTLGGAAFGGKRISKVEYTLDRGLSWALINIIKSINADHVWVFWKLELSFSYPGNYFINIKATDFFNNTQPQTDLDRRDGTNNWPTLTVIVSA